MKRKYIGIHLLLFFGVLTTISPLLWMVLTSFKTYEESIRVPITIFPEQFTLDNFQAVLSEFPFASFYLNTIIVCMITVLGQLLVCSMAAYAFARLDFAFKNVLFILCLSLMMVPSQTFLLSHYSIMVKIGLVNTVTALWLPKLFSPFGTFLLRQFFLALPKSLDESAELDGCGKWHTYFYILLPLVKPGLISLGILTTLSVFKDLIWPLIINSTPEKYTLSSGLSLLIGQHTVDYPQIMAGGLIAVVPMLVLFFIFQRQFIAGIASGGSKL